MDLQNYVLNSFVEKLCNEASWSNFQKIEKKYVHKNNQEYVLISDIQKVPIHYTHEIPSRFYEAYYCFAHPKLDCPFCFDHQLDHVPFVMVVEFFRQTCIAISHKFYNIPVEGYTNIMDDLTLHLPKFVELDLPAVIICINEVMKDNNSTHKRNVFYYIYQNNKLCAYMTTNILVMKDVLYSRLRHKCRQEKLSSDLSFTNTLNQ